MQVVTSHETGDQRDQRYVVAGQRPRIVHGTGGQSYEPRSRQTEHDCLAVRQRAQLQRVGLQERLQVGRVRGRDEERDIERAGEQRLRCVRGIAADGTVGSEGGGAGDRLQLIRYEARAAPLGTGGDAQPAPAIGIVGDDVS